MSILDQPFRDGSEATVVAALAEKALTPDDVFTRVHSGDVLRIGDRLYDLEQYAPRPERTVGDVVLHDIESLVEYGWRHYLPDEITHAYLNAPTPPPASDQANAPAPPTLTVILDPDTATAASWRQHRASVTFHPTTDWLRWLASNLKPMDQETFAGFLEGNADAIVEPGHAEILELVTNFEQTTMTTFSSSTRLQDGQRRLVYREDGVGEKDLTLPSTIRLGLPVFRGIEDRFGVSARLKFRARNGSVMFWYELVRDDLVYEAAVVDLADRFEEAHREVTENAPIVVRGVAPAKR